MKYVFATLFALYLVNFPVTQNFTPVDSASMVFFRIKNPGFNTTGSFSELAGVLTFTPADPGGCNFDVNIEARTVNTGNDIRDNHLRAEDFFDVKNYPQISFVSAKVTGTKRTEHYLFPVS